MSDEKMYIAVDKDLCENIGYCCDESGVEFDDVIDYGLRFVLDNYIDKRNKVYAKMSPNQIMRIYPEMDERTASKVIELAKDNNLAIIKPLMLPKGSDISEEELSGTTDVVGRKLCDSCSRLMEQQAYKYGYDDGVHGYCPDEEAEGDVLVIHNEESPETILPTLGSLIDRAHHVNVNIQVVMNEEE